MMKNKYIEMDEKRLSQYYKLQLADFKQIKELFEEYIFALEDWDKIVMQLTDVLDRCDEIDYQNSETAYAYAVWHFLDRYYRFQIIFGELCKNGYLIYSKDRTIDILEVGAGPAQGLFAISDHYAELNKLKSNKEFSIQSDYVEQSDGFRNFLHHFVEFCMTNDKHYMVPFHHGREKDAYCFKFEEILHNFFGYYFKEKYRYDIVIISNFLTTKNIVANFKRQLLEICKYIRNQGLLIVVGAADTSDKYKDIYSSIDKVVNRKFRNRNFFGWWGKVFENTFSYNYTDEYGDLLRQYNCKLEGFIKGKNLWGTVPQKAKDKLENTIKQTKEKTLAENWEGIHWKVVVYQKHSFFIGKNGRKNVHSNFKKQDDSGWMQAIEYTK